MAESPPRSVGTVSSYARLTGEDLLVQVHLPDSAPLTDPQLRLRDGDRRIRARADVAPADHGVVLSARFPRRRLRPGVWRVAVRDGRGAPYQRLQARLVVGRGQPVALLPGPAPRTRMAPPRPAETRSAGGLRHSVSLAGRRAAAKALSRLPDDQEARVRAALRRGRRRLSR